MNLRAVTLLLLLLGAGAAWAEPAAHEHAQAQAQAVGASVAELLALARAMNPEVAAVSLEAEAAVARADGAGAFPDPRLEVTLDDISRNDAGLPGRVGTTKYTLKQEIPWWGKRETQREIALAQSREAGGVQEDLLAEVAMKVKVAYADYHRVHLSMDQTGELIQVMRALVEFARFRYGQGMGMQLEATSAEAERGAMSAELVRLEKERHRIRARLNALVNRPPGAPLVEHPELRPLPPESALDYDTLLKRGLSANPALHMGQARLEAAEGSVRLAEKNRFPDLEVGVGVVDRRGGEERDGFEAMVGLNLPLPWGWREAERREASLMARAAQERLHGERLRVASGLKEALLSLEEARAVEKVTRESLLPQARIALQSALKGYETGNSEAITVLDAIQRLKKFQIDLVKSEYEQQVRLAEIERFAGSEL